MIRNLSLFNITYQFRIDSGLNVAKKTFREQFVKFYDSADNVDPTVIISVSVDDGLNVGELTNPKNHSLLKDGFSVDYGKYIVEYRKLDGVLFFEVKIKRERFKFVAYLKKLNNIQYCSLEERICQIIYENCIYPSLFFMKDISLVHSSGFSVDKKAFLLGGTGGVGKTSLELFFSERNRIGFINDDIAVINKAGIVFPNMAWPKIYAYNISSNRRIKELLLDEACVDDKLAFYFKKHLFGENKVRRLMSPAVLFRHSKCHSFVPIAKYIVLCRGNFHDLALRRADPLQVSEINISVLETEFSHFIQHLNWHKFNSLIAGRKPVFVFDQVLDQWKVVQRSVFSKIDTYIMEIPNEIEHEVFIKKAVFAITDLMQ